jgi:hypothetical protein
MGHVWTTISKFSSGVADFGLLNFRHPALISGPGSVVGIATGYGLDDPGIESR